MAVIVRPLVERDLPAATRIIRLAFGTFLGAPDPENFWPELDYARTRWLADPGAAFGAADDGELVGSNFATRWGSVGFFGPLTVRPDLWDRGIGKRLMEPVVARFDAWGVRHAGLFTFAHSPKHVGLYQKFDFWPRFLTAVMTKAVGPAESSSLSRYSELPPGGHEDCLNACRAVTDAVYDGLDVEREIRAVYAQELGDTVLLPTDGGLAGFAVCHCGPGTEAGNGSCYVKFGAVRPGPAANASFDRLLGACESLAARKGLSRLDAGVNLARHGAYRTMLQHGFRTAFQGVVMQRHNDAGYNRPDAYVIDDWR
ncbi:MAG TPA: GNAT family N-acetyltransferase [bacterium]|nr:GNAT family N-acetyltransferase [bacterium]